MDINIPEVVAEVSAAFERYEAALVSNDVTTLNELFWNDLRTIRYGIGETSMVTRRSRASGRPARPWAWRGGAPGR